MKDNPDDIKGTPMQSTMKAVAIDKYGKQPLTTRQLPIPAVGDNDVLAEIHAASINPVDSKIRDGKLKLIFSYDMPLVLGNDFSGTVIEIGKNVTRFKAGDEVYGRPGRSQTGTFAKYISSHEDDIALKPKNLSFEEAASIPLVGLTSYQALHDIINLQPNQKVLIHAGAGGVGTFAIQLAKTMGAYVATTASDAGHQLVKTLGADRIINYKKERFDEALKDYDAVFDTLGGISIENSFKVLKQSGHIVSIANGLNRKFAKDYNMGFMKTVLFSLAGLKYSRLEKKHHAHYTFLFMQPSGAQLEIIAELIETGKIKPVIDRVYPLDEIQEAMEYSESGRAKGKIVIKV